MQADTGETSTSARISIPTTLETSVDYKARVGKLLASSQTHVYIDTSFLMWATKIGPASRGELLDWLRNDVRNRAHVPTWTAHEYLRHHVAGTIVEELASKSDELATLVGGSFNYFRPFLDDPALPAAEGFDRLRASTREAINTFERVLKSAKEWRHAYPDHAKQIIEFINERVMAVGELYDDVVKIAVEGAARYEGRLPPGFQDRHKKGISQSLTDEGIKDGANRYGDLIFWREALGHAKSQAANALIILTNDRKNDWRMGGESNADIDESMRAIRKSWRPVPHIHPMLALEAKTYGIEETALLDSQYLAAYLLDEASVASFVEVAIVPDPPVPQTENERRKEALDRRTAEDEKKAAEQAKAAEERAAKQGYRFADDPAVVVTDVSLRRALLESREEPDHRGEALLRRARVGGDDYARISDILDREVIAGMDQKLLARISRSLHDRVLDNIPGYEEALADLGGLLPELPPNTASALLLGLMASMYLEEDNGTSRIPPHSPIADLLFAAPHEPYGELPAKTIAKRLSHNEKQPLYVPLQTVIECNLETDTEVSESDVLRSLKIAGVEVLQPAQEDSELSLRKIIKDDQITGAEILTYAAKLFGLPEARLDAGGDNQSNYQIPEGMGFKKPATVFRAKEEV